MLTRFFLILALLLALAGCGGGYYGGGYYGGGYGYPTTPPYYPNPSYDYNYPYPQ
jgi:hypothetical protein